MTTVVRTTQLEVRIDGVVDVAAFAAQCSFGFDQRYAEAVVQRTGGGTIAVAYWSVVEIKMGTDPGNGLDTRFLGYVIPIENVLYPIENVLHCRGRLYRAAFVRNTVPGGTDFAPAGGPFISDQAMVQQVLTTCGVPYTAGNIGGTGKALGSTWVDFGDPLTPSPFTWAEHQSGLDFIEQLDAASVPDTHPTLGPLGRYRTLETLNGVIHRSAYSTVPETSTPFTFTEGVDVFDARITRDVASAANRVVVTGAPAAISSGLLPAALTFTVSNPTAPYLPPGLPNGPEGFPAVTATFGSPLLEKETIAEPGNVLACQAVADFLLPEYNCAIDTLEFSTPRDDYLGIGQTIHLDSARLGLTDPTRHYWLQRLEVAIDDRGAFTQRLTCLRKS